MKKHGRRLHRMSRHTFGLGFGASLFAFAFFVAACTTPTKKPVAARAETSSTHEVHEPARSTASLENRHAKNIDILNSMPLIRGVESADASEGKYADVLAKIFAKIQDEAKAKRAANPFRGTHAKGSCFEARLSVYSKEELKNSLHYPEALASRLTHGLFSEPAKYPVVARFANGKGQHNSDKVNDVRAISFSIDTRGREPSANGDFRQDFMFNNTPLFATRNILEFYELMKTARVAQGDLSYIVNPLHLGSTLRAKKLLDTFERNDNMSYAVENYWSNVPYSYGAKADGSPAEIVKFKMSPCDGKATPHEPSDKKADDFLQADINKRVQAGGTCFLMQAQLLNSAALAKASGKRSDAKRTVTDWVENAGELWDEKVLPFYTIAKLDLLPGAALSCDDQAFSTRIHSTRSLQPLGSLSRVRSIVEETSRARRMGEK